MTTIDLKDYLRWSPGWQEHLPETARRGLLPAEAVPRPGTPPGVSEGYGTAASAAKAGLAGSTALSRVILAGVDPTASPPEGSGAPGAAAPRGGAELLRWLGSESETLLRRLPPAARGYVEALRPLAESAVEPLSAAGRQESVAGLSQALSGQLAVLRRLAAVGAPLEPLLAVARGQLGALRQAGLLPGEERAYETQVLEEIAAERLRGRIGRDAGLLAGALEGQPEAAHLSAETLAALEGYRGEQVQAQAAARGERLLTGLLRGAAAGEAPAPEARVQLAELGLSDASGLDLVPLLEGEAQVAEARRDPLALVLERYPPLKMLERMTGRGGLYRRALVTAQRAAGVPEGEIRVWDRAEGEAATAAWLSLPPETAAEPERVQGLLDFTRDHLAGLPPEFQAHAVAELVRQGLPEADASALLAIGRELAAGRGIAAQRQAQAWAVGEVSPPVDGLTAGALPGMRHADRQPGSPRPVQADDRDGSDPGTTETTPAPSFSETTSPSLTGHYVPLDDPALGAWLPPRLVNGNWISEEYLDRAERAVGKKIPAWIRSTRGDEDGLVFNWYPWHVAVKDAEVGENQYFALMEIFAAEGGLEQAPGGSAVFGILKSTVEKYGESAGVSVDILPKDLKNSERVRIFKEYINARDGALGRAGGFNALEAMNDKEIAAAIADTLWTRGGPAVRKVIQAAINDILSSEPDIAAAMFKRLKDEGRLSPTEEEFSSDPTEYRIAEDGMFGPKALLSIQMIAESPAAKRKLLTSIAQRRFDLDKSNGAVLRGDISRYKHFAFMPEGEVLVFDGE